MHWQMKGIAAGDARLACAPLAPLANSGPDPPSCFRSSKAPASKQQRGSTSEQAPASKHQQTSKPKSSPMGLMLGTCSSGGTAPYPSAKGEHCQVL